jgi:pyridoxal phosphate enzyme (YggS family)
VSIRDDLLTVERRIAGACARAGRRRDEVTLVAVSKTKPAAMIDEAIAAGVTEVGENRVQEARDKKPVVRGSARWHLIGHLQSNKAKDAVRLFDVIQTIDGVELAEKVARAAASAGKVQEVLIEVNIGNEPQKSGASPADVERLARSVGSIDALRLRGLMAIPPAEDARRWFRDLRALRDAAGLPELSMGMTEDFETAIEEGATIIRVGRAIFGERG